MTIGLLTHHAYMSGTENEDNTTEVTEGRQESLHEEPLESEDNRATTSTVRSNDSNGAVEQEPPTPAGEEGNERSKDARQEGIEEVTISTMVTHDNPEEEGDPQHRTFTEIGQTILTTIGVN
tara:strand:- start:569 stop:934 length:366 start_codon:yes stop_codon:yes gene_type:complete